MRKLRPYQIDASQSTDRALDRHGAALVVMATGLGKTVVMSDIASRWANRGAVLLLAHRVELLDQAADRFSHDLGYKPQVIQADREVDWHAVRSGQRVLIGSVQTLRTEKRQQRLFRGTDGLDWSLVLIDEAHHATAKSYRTIVEAVRSVSPDVKVLGVTATPKRTDKKALGLVFDQVSYQMEASAGIRDGWLVEPTEQRIVIEDVDFSHVTMTLNEMGEADFDQATLDQIMSEEGPLQAVARPLLDTFGPNDKVLVFASGVPHSHLLAASLCNLRPECARAMDGKTFPPGDERRAKYIEEFRQGKYQFLINFGIFTEGFDAPECTGVVIARPTKSLSLLIQMVGRVLRPLAAVDQVPDSPAARKAAIAASTKPIARVLYFIPKAANVKVYTTHDALGGNYDDEVRELAKKIADEKPGGKITEELEKAKAMHGLRLEDALRKKVQAKVDYRVENVGDYDREAVDQSVEDVKRGGASDKQIQLLMDLGVQYATAAGYSSRQAGAVIDKLRQERCTKKQANILKKFGEDTNVNFAKARAIIDEIAANGWKPRAVPA